MGRARSSMELPDGRTTGGVEEFELVKYPTLKLCYARGKRGKGALTVSRKVDILRLQGQLIGSGAVARARRPGVSILPARRAGRSQYRANRLCLSLRL